MSVRECVCVPEEKERHWRKTWTGLKKENEREWGNGGNEREGDIQKETDRERERLVDERETRGTKEKKGERERGGRPLSAAGENIPAPEAAPPGCQERQNGSPTCQATASAAISLLICLATSFCSNYKEKRGEHTPSKRAEAAAAAVAVDGEDSSEGEASCAEAHGTLRAPSRRKRAARECIQHPHDQRTAGPSPRSDFASAPAFCDPALPAAAPPALAWAPSGAPASLPARALASGSGT